MYCIQSGLKYILTFRYDVNAMIIWFLAHTLTLDCTFWINNLLKKRLYLLHVMHIGTYMADLIKLTANGDEKEEEDARILYIFV